MELFGVDILNILIIDLIHVASIGLFGGFFLHYATRYLFFENRSFKKIISVISIGCGLFFILDFIPVFGVGFGHLGFWFLIKYFYKQEWKYAAGAWFLSIFFAFLISTLILAGLGLDFIFMPKL